MGFFRAGLVPPERDAPVGGCLGTPQAAANWRASFPGAALVATVITNGFQQPYKEELRIPPKQRPPPQAMSRERRLMLEEYTCTLIQKAAIEAVPRRELGDHAFSPIVFVPKRTSAEWRPCLDAREQNAQQKTEHFSQDGIMDIFPLLRESMYAVSVDMADAYLQVPMHRADRRFLAFWGRRQGRWEEFRFRVMPFGIRHASRLLAKLLRPLQGRLHSEGIICLFYQDDWIFLGMDPEVLAAQLAFVLEWCHKLNIRFQWRKCSLEPSTTFEWLGILFDTVTMTVSLSEARLTKFIAQLEWLIPLEEVSAHQLASIIGTIESCATVSLVAFLNRRHLMRLKHKALRAGGWSGCAAVTVEARGELQYWHDEARSGKLTRHITMFSPQMVIEMDAGPRAWGAYVIPVRAVPASVATCYPLTSICPTFVEDPKEARTTGWHTTPQSVCVADRPSQTTSHVLETTGYWTAEQAAKEHISVREGRAVQKAFRSFLPAFRSLTSPDADGMVGILIRTDNINVQAYLNKGGGERNEPLAELLESLLHETLAAGFHLRAARLTSRENRAADMLSRMPYDKHDWKLHPCLFEFVQEVVGMKFDVDAFATELNHQVETFFSRFPQPGSAGVDAFLQDWRNYRNLFINPPFVDWIILQILNKIERDAVEDATLVLPIWTSRPWWPLLQALICDYPIVIPPSVSVFLPQSQSNEQPLPSHSPRTWSTGAFPVSGRRSLPKEWTSAPPSPLQRSKLNALAHERLSAIGVTGSVFAPIAKNSTICAIHLSVRSPHSSVPSSSRV